MIHRCQRLTPKLGSATQSWELGMKLSLPRPTFFLFPFEYTGSYCNLVMRFGKNRGTSGRNIGILTSLIHL